LEGKVEKQEGERMRDEESGCEWRMSEEGGESVGSDGGWRGRRGQGERENGKREEEEKRE
jgi:hypothetical protein